MALLTLAPHPPHAGAVHWPAAPLALALHAPLGTVEIRRVAPGDVFLAALWTPYEDPRGSAAHAALNDAH